MSDEKKPNVFVENMAVLTTPEGFQKYILGTKKNGAPRAVYDVVSDYTKPKKKKKKDKKKSDVPTSAYGFYLSSKKSGKKKKKKNKHWHI